MSNTLKYNAEMQFSLGNSIIGINMREKMIKREREGEREREGRRKRERGREKERDKEREEGRWVYSYVYVC